MKEGVVFLILRRKYFDFSLNYKSKNNTQDQATGLTFDHNLRLTPFLDQNCLVNTCKTESTEAIDPNI